MVVELRLKHLYRWLFSSVSGTRVMEQLMWQNDLVSVAILVNACSDKAHSSRGPSIGCQPFDQPCVGKKKCIQSLPDLICRDVDEIIVVESRVTHSGKQKDFLYVERDRKIFEPYLSKVSTFAPSTTSKPWDSSQRWAGSNDHGALWHLHIGIARSRGSSALSVQGAPCQKSSVHTGSRRHTVSLAMHPPQSSRLLQTWILWQDRFPATCHCEHAHLALSSSCSQHRIGRLGAK